MIKTVFKKVYIYIVLSAFILSTVSCNDSKTIIDKYSGIVCWGDSLTEGTKGNGVTFPGQLADRIGKKDFPVINCGVGAETAPTIVCRSGAMKFVVAEDLVVKQSSKPVEIKLAAEDGHQVNPLRRYPGGEWIVELTSTDGNIVKGTLAVVQEEPSKPEFSYTFTRESGGDEVQITAGSEIYLELYNEYEEYEDYFSIVFIGQNGGWENPDDLVKLQKMILDKYGDGKNYLIIGLHTGTAEERSELESVMEQEYGNHYLNLREYMCENGLKKAGIKPTDEDKERLSEGIVPRSLLSDDVHFNAKGYKVLGDAVYERLIELSSEEKYGN